MASEVRQRDSPRDDEVEGQPFLAGALDVRKGHVGELDRAFVVRHSHLGLRRDDREEHPSIGLRAEPRLGERLGHDLLRLLLMALQEDVRVAGGQLTPRAIVPELGGEGDRAPGMRGRIVEQARVARGVECVAAEVELLPGIADDENRALQVAQRTALRAKGGRSAGSRSQRHACLRRHGKALRAVRVRLVGVHVVLGEHARQLVVPEGFVVARRRQVA
jgi:hypothetical protein